MSEPRNWWVVCDDYTSGPYTREQAEYHAAKEKPCPLPHRAAQADRKPVPAWQLARKEEPHG